VEARATRLRIRLAPFAEAPVDAVDRLLDWAPGTREATVEFGADFFAGWQPTAAGSELLRFAAGVYCADRTVLRDRSPDGWTREFRIEVPVSTRTLWKRASWPAVLGFLTGDRWAVQTRPTHPAKTTNSIGLPVDAVSLFSGGLDSLCGVIDLLEEDPRRRLLLVAHHEGGQASTAQRSLYAALGKTYGERVLLRRMFCRPAPPHPAQVRPLPDGHERTTRSRSLLFIAGALAAASAAGDNIPVYVPENGWIGLNVPLTRARSGSASTRTTHPHFLQLLSTASHEIGVTNPVINSYRLQTKGEVLAACRNRTLLARLARTSVSCAHPETARWRDRPQGNCGYCVPCLVRRAALAPIGLDRADDYAWDALTDPHLLDQTERTGADLRAIVHGVAPDLDELAIVRNAPLPAGEHSAHLRLWRRGADEIRTWLTGATGPLAQYTATAWRRR
jgi:hypothetical protein